MRFGRTEEMASLVSLCARAGEDLVADVAWSLASVTIRVLLNPRFLVASQPPSSCSLTLWKISNEPQAFTSSGTHCTPSYSHQEVLHHLQMIDCKQDMYSSDQADLTSFEIDQVGNDFDKQVRSKALVIAGAAPT